MDLLYGHDNLDETDMVDFLDSNMFHTPVTGFPNPEECYENDWLTSFLDDPVLNDKMMTDAMQPPCIKSEHSYSINDQGNEAPGSPLGLAKCEDLENDFFGSSSALDLTIKSSSSSHPKSADAIISTDAFLTSTTSSSLSHSSCLPSSLKPSSFSQSSSMSSSSLSSPLSSTISGTLMVDQETAAATNSILDVKPPTILLTTTQSPSFSSTSTILGNTYLSSDLSLPAIQIKQEPLEQAMEQAGLESITLPPTPPGSSGSDSEGSQSPHRSAPSSPMRYTSSSLRHHHHHHHSSPLSPNKAYTQQPLFVNPISQSGVLLLSEEEKRTLISEGYPIPTKLPLTKQEEKNLKKIRRKIKNKISAQESRRKKKEYLEALEKRVEAYNHENCDLKKKVESLENSNRSLLGQLQKLQSLVKMPKASQTGTALMVLVFCFAVFLGSMSPSLNIGYATKPARLGFVQHHNKQQSESRRSFYGPEMGPMMMTAHDTSDPYENDPYLTPKLKSRMLMSVDQDEYCDDFRAMPWDSAPSCPTIGHGNKGFNSNEMATSMMKPGIDLMGGADLPDNVKTHADTTVIMVMTGMENSSSSQDDVLRGAALPDVTIDTKDIMAGEHRMAGNFSTELETA